MASASISFSLVPCDLGDAAAARSAAAHGPQACEPRKRSRLRGACGPPDPACTASMHCDSARALTATPCACMRPCSAADAPQVGHDHVAHEVRVGRLAGAPLRGADCAAWPGGVRARGKVTAAAAARAAPHAKGVTPNATCRARHRACWTRYAMQTRVPHQTCRTAPCQSSAARCSARTGGCAAAAAPPWGGTGQGVGVRHCARACHAACGRPPRLRSPPPQTTHPTGTPVT